VLTALLEYLDLLTQVAESGPANARPAGLWAPALVTVYIYRLHAWIIPIVITKVCMHMFAAS